MYYGKPLRVRLRVDLTRYHPEFQLGAEGWTAPARGMWARAQDRFTTVVLESGAWLDVLESGYEEI